MSPRPDATGGGAAGGAGPHGDDDVRRDPVADAFRLVDGILRAIPDIASAYDEDLPADLKPILEALGVRIPTRLRRPPTVEDAGGSAAGDGRETTSCASSEATGALRGTADAVHHGNGQEAATGIANGTASGGTDGTASGSSSSTNGTSTNGTSANGSSSANGTSAGGTSSANGTSPGGTSSADATSPGGAASTGGTGANGSSARGTSTGGFVASGEPAEGGTTDPPPSYYPSWPTVAPDPGSPLAAGPERWAATEVRVAGEAAACPPVTAEPAPAEALADQPGSHQPGPHQTGPHQPGLHQASAGEAGPGQGGAAGFAPAETVSHQTSGAANGHGAPTHADTGPAGSTHAGHSAGDAAEDLRRAAATARSIEAARAATVWRPPPGPGAGDRAADVPGPPPADPMAGRGTIVVPVDAALALALQQWSDHLDVPFSEILAGAMRRYLRHLSATDVGLPTPRPWPS